MTTIFVAHTQEDAQCAEQMHKEFETQGYTAWREPPTLDPTSPAYPRAVETAILGSGAVILVWSASAAKSQWLQRFIAFGQRLQKQIVPVIIDGTSLPPTLLSVEQITSQVPCTDAVSQIVPLLPTPNSKDALLLLFEQAANDGIGKRKGAIDAAVAMLQRDEQREALLALLDHLAYNDSMAGVRDKAQEALAGVQQEAAQLPPDMDPQHSVGFSCRHCGYINYFDKHIICKTVPIDLVRGGPTKKGLVKLTGHTCKQCGREMELEVDCEGYR